MAYGQVTEVQHVNLASAAVTGNVNVTVAAPAQGNLLCFVIHWKGTMVAPSLGAGWISGALNNTSATIGIHTYYKIAGAGESTTQTPCSVGTAITCWGEFWEVTGQAQGKKSSGFPIALKTDVVNQDASATPPSDSESCTVTFPNELILCSGGTTVNQTPTLPSGFSTDDSFAVTGASFQAVHQSNPALGALNVTLTYAGGTAQAVGSLVEILPTPAFFENNDDAGFRGEAIGKAAGMRAVAAATIAAATFFSMPYLPLNVATKTATASGSIQTIVPPYDWNDVASTTAANYQLRQRQAASQVTTVPFCDVAFTATQYDSTVLGDNPLAYYRLDETSGTVMNDSGPNNLPGSYGSGVTLAQPTLVPSTSGYSLGVNGINPASVVATVPNNSILQPTTALSIEAWVTKTNTTNPKYIVSGGDDTLSLAPFTLRFAKPFVQPAFSFRLNNNGTSVTCVAGVQQPNSTYHVVATWDNSSQQMRVYVNGVLENTISGVAGPISGYDVSSPLAIASSTGSTQALLGDIDEVAIYGYALTQAQVVNHYQIGTGKILPPLQGQLFDSDSGIVASARSQQDRVRRSLGIAVDTFVANGQPPPTIATATSTATASIYAVWFGNDLNDVIAANARALALRQQQSAKNSIQTAFATGQPVLTPATATQTATAAITPLLPAQGTPDVAATSSAQRQALARRWAIQSVSTFFATSQAFTSATSTATATATILPVVPPFPYSDVVGSTATARLALTRQAGIQAVATAYQAPPFPPLLTVLSTQTASGAIAFIVPPFNHDDVVATNKAQSVGRAQRTSVIAQATFHASPPLPALSIASLTTTASGAIFTIAPPFDASDVANSARSNLALRARVLLGTTVGTAFATAPPPPIANNTVTSTASGTIFRIVPNWPHDDVANQLSAYRVARTRLASGIALSTAYSAPPNPPLVIATVTQTASGSIFTVVPAWNYSDVVSQGSAAQSLRNRASWNVASTFYAASAIPVTVATATKTATGAILIAPTPYDLDAVLSAARGNLNSRRGETLASLLASFYSAAPPTAIAGASVTQTATGAILAIVPPYDTNSVANQRSSLVALYRNITRQSIDPFMVRSITLPPTTAFSTSTATGVILPIVPAYDYSGAVTVTSNAYLRRLRQSTVNTVGWFFAPHNIEPVFGNNLVSFTVVPTATITTVGFSLVPAQITDNGTWYAIVSDTSTLRADLTDKSTYPTWIT